MTPAGGSASPGQPPRWARLQQYLRADPRDEVELSLDQLDVLVDGRLPPAARRAAGEWWTNNPRHHYARAWLDAGRLADWAHLGNGVGAVRFVRGAREVPDVEHLSRANLLRRRRFLGFAVGAVVGEQPWETRVRDGWTGPHTLYLIHLPAAGLLKIGMGKGDGARRIRDLLRGREAVLVETVQTENLHVANVAECDVLDEVRPWYRYGDPRHTAGGATECWDDCGPQVDLASFASDVKRFVHEAATLPIEARREALEARARRSV